MMDAVPPVAAKKIGLFPSRTNLPCTLWLSRCPAVGTPELSVEVTWTKGYENPAAYAVLPWFHRLHGPYRWLDMACLGPYVRHNQPVIEEYWRGADARAVASRLVPLPEDVRQARNLMAASIDTWAARMEAEFTATGKLDLGYASLRPLLQPEPSAQRA